MLDIPYDRGVHRAVSHDKNILAFVDQRISNFFQEPVCSLKEIFEAREDEIPPIRKYLQDHGLHLYHSDKFTWKVGTDEVKEEKDRLKETLDAARKRAKDAIEKEPGLLQERVGKAIEILSAADRMATKYDCDIRTHEQVLRDYAVLLEEHMLAFPYLIKDAPEVAGRLLSMMETILGSLSCATALSSRARKSRRALRMVFA